MRADQHPRLGWAFLDFYDLSLQRRSPDFLADSLLNAKFMEHLWRILEGRDEWSRILGLDAKPEAGIVGGIGPGFVLLGADHANAYVLGAGHGKRTYRNEGDGVKLAFVFKLPDSAFVFLLAVCTPVQPHIIWYSRTSSGTAAHHTDGVR
jgi:hypothetical protein